MDSYYSGEIYKFLPSLLVLILSFIMYFYFGRRKEIRYFVGFAMGWLVVQVLIEFGIFIFLRNIVMRL